MCDVDGFTESSRYLIIVGGQPGHDEWERRRRAAPSNGDRRKLIRPEETLPPVAENRCRRLWNGDVLFPVEEIVCHTPNADPYETRSSAASLDQIRAMLTWAIGRGLNVQVVNGMTCHPGGGFNEYFTTVPLDLAAEQVARLFALEEAALRTELEQLVAGRPTIRPNPMAKVA